MARPRRRTTGRVGVSAVVDRSDRLTLHVRDLTVDVLTGIYSEETNRPQPLRIAISCRLRLPERFTPDTPLDRSKNYLDLKHAATTALPPGRHFKLVEAVADHIVDTLMIGDPRVEWVEVSIDKLAIAQNGEAIGITLSRHRAGLPA